MGGPAPWNHPKLQHQPTGNEAVTDADVEVQPLQRVSGFNQGFKPTALSPGDLAELMEAAVELRSATPYAEQEKEEELLAVVAAVSARASAQDGVQDTNRPSSKGHISSEAVTNAAMAALQREHHVDSDLIQMAATAAVNNEYQEEMKKESADKTAFINEPEEFGPWLLQ